MAASKESPRRVGRYAVFDEFASGGMASISLARLIGPVGFSRTVAVKRLHPHLVKDPNFCSMFIDEARLAARIRHPNVVHTLDVVEAEGDVLQVLEYVVGESLGKLMSSAASAGETIPPSIVVTIMQGVLHGLHAAHEAVGENGQPLGIVHRDVSPQNIMVGIDGGARVLDFGVAKARDRIQTTREGEIKGKLAYMAPEQLSGEATRRSDIYAASIVMWEALTGRRLFSGENAAETLSKVLHAHIEPPSALVSGVDPALDAIVMRGLSRDAKGRYATARDMAVALEASGISAPASHVGDWVQRTAAPTLALMAERVRVIEAPAPPASEARSAPGSGVALLREEPSSLSVTGPPAQRAPVRVRTALLGGVLVLGAVAAIVAIPRSRKVVESVAPEAAASSAGPTSVLPSALASAVPATSTSAPTATSVTPSSTTESTPSKPRSRPPRPKQDAPSPSSVPTPAPRNTCDPPYQVGPNGEKIWIPQCL